MATSSASVTLQNDEQLPKKQSFKMPNLMTESTIYQRHEERAARSYAMRDDPRPALIRVLSGLPGFRVIIPPYQPSESCEMLTMTAEPATTSASKIGGYSEDTLFATKGECHETSASLRAFALSPSPLIVAGQSSIAAGLAGGGAHFLFGGRNNPLPAASSPFTFKKSKPLADIALFGENLAFQLSRQKPIQRASSSSFSNRAWMHLTSSTCLLFGIKSLAHEQLQDSDQAGLGSSAAAGIVVGIWQVLLRQQHEPERFWFRRGGSPLATPLPLASSHLVRQAILSAILYFGTYDVMLSMLRPEASETSHSKIDNCSLSIIALSGASAGVVSSSVPQLWMGVPTVRVVPVLLRAAPQHGLLWVGYESIRRAMEPTTSS